MTNEEAIKRLKEIHDVDLLNIESWAINPYLQALEIAMEAIGYRVPKSPDHLEKYWGNFRIIEKCPTCGYFPISDKFCPKCGQHIDKSIDKNDKI